MGLFGTPDGPNNPQPASTNPTPVTPPPVSRDNPDRFVDVNGPDDADRTGGGDVSDPVTREPVVTQPVIENVENVDTRSQERERTADDVRADLADAERLRLLSDPAYVDALRIELDAFIREENR